MVGWSGAKNKQNSLSVLIIRLPVCWVRQVLKDPHPSLINCQNPKSACEMRRLVAHVADERDSEKGLDQPGRESVFGPCPGLMWNPACHLSRQEKRSGCGRVKCRAVPSATNQRAREAYCGARAPVGCAEDDRS